MGKEAEITEEMLLELAEKLEPLPNNRKWEIKAISQCVISYGAPRVVFYTPETNAEQQLRLRDYLATKGASLVTVADEETGAKTSCCIPDNRMGVLSIHEDISACAILAAHALIKQEQGNG